MNPPRTCTVVTFYTTAAAMAFEAACRAGGVEGKLFSCPRQLSADCGIAWQSPAGAEPRLRALAADNALETEAFYEMEL